MKAMMNTEVAVNNVGIMITPNQPMYKRFSVLVIHSQKRAQRLDASFLAKIAVIIINSKINKNSPNLFSFCLPALGKGSYAPQLKAKSI